jgi:hypothetical protein
MRTHLDAKVKHFRRHESIIRCARRVRATRFDVHASHARVETHREFVANAASCRANAVSRRRPSTAKRDERVTMDMQTICGGSSSSDASGAHEHVCPLDDARYDAIVVWCDAHAEDDQIVVFDLAITAGAHRGDTLTVLAARRVLGRRSELDVVGVPCVLVVRDSHPTIEW